MLMISNLKGIYIIQPHQMSLRIKVDFNVVTIIVSFTNKNDIINYECITK